MRYSKKGRNVLRQSVRVKYVFVREHQETYPVRRLCKTLEIHPSGYYAWLHAPDSTRTIEDRRLLGHVKQSWLESGSIYGYRKVWQDLRELGELCGINRIHRLKRQEKLRSQTGYHRRPRARSGPPSVHAPNHLQRQFAPAEPNQVWVTDITYIRTHEGWLYLAAILDLFSRQVIGWSMGARMDKDLALNALMMAVWRRHALIVDHFVRRTTREDF